MTGPKIIPRWRTLRIFRQPSLRTRIVYLTVVLLAVGLLTSDLATLASLRGTLVERVDRQLAGVTDLASIVDPATFGSPTTGVMPGQPPRPTTPSVDADAQPLALDVITDIYLAYLSPDGTVSQAFRTGPYASAKPPRLPVLSTAAVAARAGRAFQITAADGTAWRVVVKPRATNDGTSVVAAATLAGVDMVMARNRVRFAGISLVVLAIMTLGGLFAVRMGLRPLRRIEETAGAIAAGDLGSRVPAYRPGTEIGQLGNALNSMLAQLETAITAQQASERKLREFISDASHELRTPIAGVKGFAELYRMGAFPDRREVDNTMERIEREATRLSRLIDDLLLLAQLDERGEPTGLRLRLAPVDLRALAAEAWHQIRALDPARSVTLTGPGGGPTGEAPTVGDEQRLWQVVSNLVGNAIAYTPAGSPIRIGVGTVDDLSILEIADSGPGLTADQAARVFERFYRTDSSRSRDHEGGAGLGLPIAHSLVAAHGGRIELTTAPEAGATFRIVLTRYGEDADREPEP